MKLLIISDLIPIVEDSTIPNVIKDFCDAFVDFNQQVTVIRPNFLLNSIIRKHKIIKEKTYKFEKYEIINKNFILPFIFESRNFIDKLKKENFDLIISHIPSGHIYSDLINKKLNLAHISIVHQSDYTVLNDFKYKIYFKKRLKTALNNSTATGARNNFLNERLDSDFILPSFIEEKYVLNCQKKFNKKKLKIITLSRLIKRKNIDLVIKALKKVNFDFEYSIYGDGKEKKNLENLIKKYDLQNHIKIYPYIEHKKIYQKLNENDIFILPSVNETFGISYIEAMARGLIVIGTKNTGVDGVIENNQNGYLIEPTEENITKKLNDIFYLESNKKQEISNNSVDTVKNHYTKEEVMKKYFEQIKKYI